MNKLIIITIPIIVLTFNSCKKKETPLEPIPVVSTVHTTGLGIPEGLIKSTGDDYCSLSTYYSFKNIGGVVTTEDSSAYAAMYSVPSNSVNSNSYVWGGSIILNSGNFFYNSMQIPPTYYLINTVSINNTLNWSVSGSGTITAFSQTFTASYPKYTGGSLLPDTCIKSNGININITGVSNYFQDSLYLSLTSTSGPILSKKVGLNGIVNFSSTELSGYPTNQTLKIKLSLFNYFSATHNGFKHGFSNGINYTKYSYLK